MSVKTAQTDFPIHALLRERFSPRAFLDKPISDEQLGSLLEAARWAPSARNEQPWRWFVGRKGDGPAYEKLAECLLEGNHWAKNAPLLMLSTVGKVYSQTGKAYRHAWHDAGLALMSLIVQAQALGLFAHPMAGFSATKAHELLGIPDSHDPVTMLAVGYLGDPETLVENHKKQELAPRTRHPLNELYFKEAWGKPYLP